MYLAFTIILIVAYILGIIGIKYIKKNKYCDIVIPITIFITYLYCVVTIYLKSGFKDWNFKNAMPTANVSPFMFFSILIICILPKNIKKYGFTLISLLSVGMVVAGMITMIFNHLRSYTFYLHFALDSIAHLLLSLYGIYLFKTDQTFKNIKNNIFSGLVIVSVAVIMLIINLIFKTSFFGLSLYGNHNIYNIVVCNNGVLSAIIYFNGLMLVLLIGYLFRIFLSRMIYKN